MSFEKSSLESVKSSASLATPSPVAAAAGGFLVELVGVDDGVCPPMFNGFPHAFGGVDGVGCCGFPHALLLLLGRADDDDGVTPLAGFAVGKVGNSSFVVRRVLVVGATVVVVGLGGLAGGNGDSARAGSFGVVVDVLD